jgi:deoxyribodipyrimidine photo-lyase
MRLAGGWTPGEAGAQARLLRLPQVLAGYAARRDALDRAGGSGLSPHLRWGEVAPWAAWRAAEALPAEDRESFRTELLWREFAHHRLWWDGDLEVRAVGKEVAGRSDPAGLRAWRRGRTGVPAVDAGMRQLWQDGWISNRARLLAAAFLTRHLLLDWRLGEAWFWNVLIDACPANNPVSWQWSAGCGPDAVPFFRVLNPVLQVRRHDPEASWIRRFVPEIAGWSDPHVPWEAGGPAPIVDLDEGRRRALAGA